MSKGIKIALKSLGILILVVLIALFTLPFLFKGKLVTLAKNVINENVNAKVDFEDVSLSLFKHFPNVGLSLENLSVVGVGKFEGDTLAKLASLEMSVNLWSYLKNDVIDINSLELNTPFVHARVLADSSANWDIMKVDTTAVQVETPTDTSASSFKLQLKKFELNEGTIVYEDATTQTAAVLENLNLKLAGDLSAAKTVLDLEASVDTVVFVSAGNEMVSGLALGIKTKVDADLEHSIYKIAGAEINLNRMLLTADGQVAMVGEKGEDMDIDLTYTLKVPSLASLLDLIPKEYTKDIPVETKGEFSMNGWVKGLYSETSMPVLGIDLQVRNGYIKYSGFTESINNLSIDLKAALDQNHDENSKVALSKLHFDLAGNPFDASTTVLMPFTDPNIDAKINGRVNLASLKSALPLPDSLSLNGVVTANVAFAGLMSQIEKEQYDKLKLDGTLGLTNFSVVTSDFPQEVKISKMDMKFNPAKVTLSAFDATIGKSDLHLTGTLENFLNYIFSDKTIKGQLQLTSNLIDCNELMGSSTTPATTETAPTTTSTDGVFVVPNNLDFNMKANINRLVYDKLDMTNVGGTIAVKDGKLNLNNLVMNAMGGAMTLSGNYFAPNTSSAVTDMSMGIRSVEIKRLVQTIGFIDSLLPVAENMAGKVSLNLAISTPLKSDMSLDIDRLNGSGNFSTDSLAFINSETLNTFTSLLKMDQKSNVLKNININFGIKNGRIQVPPFNVKLGNVAMKVGGEHGLTSMAYNVDVNMPTGKLGAEAGNQLSGVLAKAGITNVSPNLSVIPVGVAITGTMKKPKFSLGTPKFGGAGGEGQAAVPTIKQQATDIVNQQVDQYKKQADTLIQKQKDEAVNKLKEELKKKLPF